MCEDYIVSYQFNDPSMGTVAHKVFIVKACNRPDALTVAQSKVGNDLRDFNEEIPRALQRCHARLGILMLLEDFLARERIKSLDCQGVD